MGVLDGIRVVDFSWGAAGPVVAMLLSDHGAEVLKIEPPGGDPFRAASGANAWLRGRRSAELDLTVPADHAVMMEQVAAADVVLMSFGTGVPEKLGIDAASLLADNPALIHCSITGYGDHGAHSGRPAIDALVAARLGIQWEQRGFLGGPIVHTHHEEPFLEDLEVPPGMEPGSPREGPIFSYSPWPSLATAYLAATGINAALLARESTGRGQAVRTSLMQGMLALTTSKLQRVENPDATRFRSWILDRRAPKGIYRCSDGRWIQQWVPNPHFVLSSADGDELAARTGSSNVRDDPQRIEPDPHNLVVLAHYHPLMAEAFARFPSDEWTRVGAAAGVPLQPVRTPEEALADPALLAEGAVVDVAHPEHGTIRQVGVLYGLSATPGAVQGPVPTVGQHTAEVRAERPARRTAITPSWIRETSDGPLGGVVVLDLGFAVAGPFGAQVLADLGATVIKVNAARDPWWHAMHIAYGANRGKRSVSIDLKTEAGLATLYRMVARADVVHSNMRPDAHRRLKVDEASLRAVNPDIIFCHTRGFDRGPRSNSPGNDQTGCSLAGVTYEDGGSAAPGGNAKPFWSLTSLGDTGNGFLSAIGVIQALYHRARTGETQSVDTSIINAGMLISSYAGVLADGSPLPRPHLDEMQLGLSRWYRLYETAEGWLCLAAMTTMHQQLVTDAVGDDLEAGFRTRSAHDWAKLLDDLSVPCEVSTLDHIDQFFDDPENRRLGLVSDFAHPSVGRIETVGTMIDFDDTPGTIWGPPPLVGQHTREILTEFGFANREIDDLLARGAITETLGVD